MRYFFALATLITAALAVAIPEPQDKCNPNFNCCTYSESACSERLQACTAICNGETRKGICNDLGAGWLSCDTA